MKKKEQKVTKYQLKSSYFITTVSISLVLFLLGLMGFFILNAKNLSNHVKENIGFSIILHDNIKEVDMIRLQKELDATNYVKSTEYITKEKAARLLIHELGEDFIDFLGYNPLLASIEVKLYADFANLESISIIENDLKKYPQIKEVFYQKSLVNLINENVKKISFVLLLFSGLMFIISIALINNTIRLSVYSKRFIINTMKLVGATRKFIRTPFILKSILYGAYGAIIALTLLAVVIYLAQKEFQELAILINVEMYVILFVSVFLSGIFIALISTYFAVNKYLRIKTDTLYF
ncbi:MAG: ABC transporter permease [Bacteroidales bacterium]|nr:ABC transporter permease [Bacteroidales bacterium]